jgi:hypothetical protein
MLVGFSATSGLKAKIGRTARLDANMGVVGLVADLDILLVPSDTEAALEDAFEVWIGRFIRQERTALYRKEIKGKTRLESVEIQNQSVIQFASNDRRPCHGLFIRNFAKPTDILGFGTRSKLISSFLSCAEAATGGHLRLSSLRKRR